MARQITIASARTAENFWRPLALRAQWDVHRAAQLLHRSLRSLERFCQQDLGCPPREWFQRERLATAAQRLAAGHSVKTVALELNYTRAANFSRDFKRHFGRRPTALAPSLADQFLRPPAAAAPDPAKP